jgi:bifunctional DNase/RNase
MKEVKSIDISLTSLGFALILKPKGDERILPIFIGALESHSITLALQGEEYPRPLTHDLLKNIMQLTGIKVNKVIVSDLIENTFYAKIDLETRDDRFLVDARPSDAIALAIRVGCPVYIEDKVLDEAGIKMVMDEGEMSIITLSRQDEITRLKEELERAVREERYEDAAKIRDRLKELETEN